MHHPFSGLNSDGKVQQDEESSKNLKSTLTLPKTIKELTTKSYVDNDPSIIKDTAHVDFNDRNLDIVRFVKINSLPAVGEHFTTKFYVDDVIFYTVVESSLLGLDPY